MVSVLSIQSHVVHGYVGNRAAVYLLQSHGIKVDAINSVQFSNHTGYPSWTGKVLNSGELWDLYQGLLSNNLVNYTHVLTGYINSSELMVTIANIITDIKKMNPDLIYFCDPVMGDNGKLYKSFQTDTIDLYKKHMLPLANILKLNQTEAEFLSGFSINNSCDAIQAMNYFHSFGIKHVIISSLLFETSKIHVLGSIMEDIGKYRTYKIVVPYLNGTFIGTGDCFAALLLAWSTKMDMPIAVHKSVSTMHNLLKSASKENKEILLVGNDKHVLDPEMIEELEYLNI